MRAPVMRNVVIFLSKFTIHQMLSRRILPIFCLLLLFISCSQNQNNSPSVTATVTDQNGKTLPNFSLQLIYAEDSWTGKPYKSQTNNGNNFISLPLPEEDPVVLKFVAPGYQPLYTFLTPVNNDIEISAQLGAPTKVPNPQPRVVGNFNDFDSRSGKIMSQDDNGIWKATVESNNDTLRYVINRYIIGGNITGTLGEVTFQKESRGIETSFVNTITKSSDDSLFHIQFDPSAYQEMFDSAKPKVQFLNDIPKSVEGIANVYTLMIEEYWNMVTNRGLAQMKGEKPAEYDYSKFFNTINQIEDKYANSSVSKAIDIAKFRLLESDTISVSKAESFLQELSPDSPLWLMHFPVLTSAVNRAGLESNIKILTNIINETPFEALRGEALYNRLRYYYEKDKKEKWHSDFTQLVSNHPEHFRTSYAYERYAPDQPITKGEPLIYDNFNGLKKGKTISLSEIEESYLLIDFWATWCGPCIESLPKLKETYQKFGESDFSILSISLDETPEQVTRFHENEMTMPWYHAHEKRGSKKVREMGIVGVPHYVLLGPNRKVITNDQSKLKGENLTKTLQKYLNP
jgi:thiol-disulfide isomerase/thioredoxin